jgi:hypothetical protein
LGFSFVHVPVLLSCPWNGTNEKLYAVLVFALLPRTIKQEHPFFETTG